ncbi:O-antigen ligase [Caenimonas sp. SL110]|uniref:O-antigen ligase family protein n=1 Tax=Caenimonas sp. SL110 TaxID=1450524 RepID=UPI0006536880|nr:O-antigen ligase family protein [Caenimonas sp. SL110]
MIRRSPAGYLHWIIAAMIALGAIDVLLSGRDLSTLFLDLASGAGSGSRHAITPWLQRLVSVLLMIAVAERIANHIMLHRRMPSALLTAAYVTYWLCTVAATALLSAHPQVSHEYLYTIAIGGAVLLATAAERDRILDTARDALVILLAAGALLIPVNPSLVMDASYTQGLIPGLPRHGGLAPHPVALGMFAQICLLLLQNRPYRNRWLTAGAWILGLGVLFMAQSKTAWIAFFLCSACVLIVRNGAGFWRRMGDPREGAFAVAVCLGIIVVVTLVGALLISGEAGSLADGFLSTDQGAQLMSMTGRDRIWEVAMEEWRASPVFGYGPLLWDDAFRASIGMPNATNAHNQFMDTLARSGTVGAFGLVFYAAVLLVLSIRYAPDTGGLSLALFIALALRSMTEVPLLLLGYGYELFSHLLLLVSIAAAAGLRKPQIATRHSHLYQGAL